MARMNTLTRPEPIRTHEGGRAVRINAEQQLRRLVMTSLLWEDQFYVDGVEAAKQIAAAVTDLIRAGKQDVLVEIAKEARDENRLRHVPLLIAALYAAQSSGDSRVGALIEHVVQRADELAEFLAIYAKIVGVAPKGVDNGLKGRLPAQVKKGLARAFLKFDAYQLAKYDRAADVTLRDTMALAHPKAAPKATDQNALARAELHAGILRSPDTWEVALSAGGDKREVFERMLRQPGKLGYLALLRNLRNMDGAGVDKGLVKDAIRARKGARNVLPFRYIAAARHARWATDALDDALLAALAETEPFDGETVILLDHSGSMKDSLSGKSDMRRADAAAALAAVWPGSKRVFSFTSGGYSYRGGSTVVELPSYRGLALVEAFMGCQGWGGTYLGDAISKVQGSVGKMDRFVVVTDEQSADRVGKPGTNLGYMINVGAYKNGVGYGNGWTHVDGWSENVFRWLKANEAEQN